ncbi:unnamed protein product, partial [Meganyctiphanes norvegica]
SRDDFHRIKMKHQLLRLALALLFIIYFLILTSASNDQEWKQERLHSRGEQQDKQTISQESERSPNYIKSIEDNEQEKISFDNSVSDDVPALEELEEDNASINEEYNYELPPFDYNLLPHCPPDSKDKDQEVVVVSTLDGRITGLDAANGAVLWSHQTGGKRNEMLTSSMTNLDITSTRGEWIRLIPSLDGSIYRFNGEDFEALPLTADTLLHSSYKFNKDTIFSGGKSSEVWGMDVSSGRLLYRCNVGGCHREKDTASPPANILVVKRVTQSIRAVDPKNGDERWNFSVGQHEVNLAGKGCSSSGSGASEKKSSWKLRFIVPDGRIMAVDEESHLVWEQKLPSALVNAWSVNDGELEEVDLFSGSSVPALSIESHKQKSEETDSKKEPALYVGVHNEQLYIQQSGALKSRVAASAQIFTQGHPNLATFPRVQWKPYLATSLSRTPIMNIKKSSKHPLLIDHVKKDDDTTALSVQQDVDYPYDSGYYLYGDEFSPAPNESSNDEVDDIFEDESIIDDITAHVIHFCFHIGPDTWLQIFFVLTLIVVIHVLFLRYIVANMRRRLTLQALLLVRQLLHNIIQNNPNIARLIERLGMQALPPPENPQPDQIQPVAAKAALEKPVPAEQTPIPLPPPEILDRTSSQNSESSSVQFTSRYTTDFEPIQCLGRGGFGVVFEVRNKLDENQYAVKRIPLPLKESSAERVKREVRALAKLNHNNIVRYYNSWLETPPSGWLEDTDSWWKNTDNVNSSLLSPDMDETDLDESKLISEPSKIVQFGEDGILNLVPQYIHSITKSDKNPFFQDKPFFSLKKQQNHDFNNFNEWEESNPFSFDPGDCNSHATYDDDSINDNSEEGNCMVSKSKPYSTNSDNCEGDDSFVVFENSEKSMSVEEIDTKNSSRKRNTNSGNKCKSKFKLDNYNESSSDFIAFEDSISKNRNNDSVLSSVGNEENNKIIGETQQGPVQRLSESEDKQRPKSLDVTNVSKGKIAIQCRTFMYIQMELCKKESLRDWLVKNRDRDVHEVYSIFNDIIRAVEYVHDNQLMHRDLKPNNIFFSLDGEVKIGDFGLVTTIAEEEEELRTPACDETFQNSPTNPKHTHRVGTQLYMSPEQVVGLVYDYKVDIYSLGLIFFEMLVPFSTGMERLKVMTLVRNRTFPTGFKEKFPDEWLLLEMMLSHNPVERPTTRGIRSRKPLSQLQGNDINDIKPEDHFRLLRSRSHNRSNSGSSFSFLTSASI